MENSIATAFGLAVLILVLGPVSGAHFNPVVSAADWFLGRRAHRGLPGRDVVAYTGAQVAGAALGAVLAKTMYGLAPVEISDRARASWPAALAEVVATAGLVAVIIALARTGRGALVAAAVGAYIGAAYWFTSSTSFANPAVTIGRVFTDTFAGIAPSSPTVTRTSPSAASPTTSRVSSPTGGAGDGSGSGAVVATGPGRTTPTTGVASRSSCSLRPSRR